MESEDNTVSIDLRELVDRFCSAKVLLIGDSILDIYTYGTAMGLSAETPTIVARRKEVRHTLGGAALVCRNLLELGASVQFVTLVGGDDESEHVRSFSAPNLVMRAVVDEARPTTVKHRFWVDGYKLFQLDQRDDSYISDRIAELVIEQVNSALLMSDIVVISDYRHGLLSPNTVDHLMRIVRDARKPVYVDSQVSQTASNHKLYRGGSIICLNLKEARCIDPLFLPSTNVAAFSKLNEALETRRIVVKLGADGSIFQDGDRIVAAPAHKVQVIDTTGAGDAFLSAFCLVGLQNPKEALRIANAWAGLSVQIHGTMPPNKADLLTAMEAN